MGDLSAMLILFVAIQLMLGVAGVQANEVSATKPVAIDIDDRVEPFVDLALVERMTGLTHQFTRPVELRELTQPPSNGYYATVIYADKKYRHYCRETIPGYQGSNGDGNPGEATAYAESDDGIHWTRPKLGIFEVNGSRDNHYILAHQPPFSHNFSPFLDTRPGCPPAQRFKALAGTMQSGGLVVFVSADGVRWSKWHEEPVIKPAEGSYMFDSQNVAFWSAREACYVAYCRRLDRGLRSIVRTTSEDFMTWTPFEAVPANLPGEHLYTSQAHPYFRAEHLTIGLATRFLPDRGKSTDIMLMTSRHGRSFDRVLKEAFIRPAMTPESWGNRGNYAALNVYPLRNNRAGVPEEWRHQLHEEMAIMVRDRIYVLPIDGFASVHAGDIEGELVTRPLVFSGKSLFLNYETSAAGYVRVEIQDQAGKPIAGYAVGNLKEDLRGNQRAQMVQWGRSTDLSSLAGRSIRLRFVMREADLYSVRFSPR